MPAVNIHPVAAGSSAGKNCGEPYEKDEEKLKSREERMIAGKREWTRQKTAAERAGIPQKSANKPPAGLYNKGLNSEKPGIAGP